MFLVILSVALFNLALGYGLALFLHGRNGPFSDWEFPLAGLLWSARAVEGGTAETAAPPAHAPHGNPPPRAGSKAAPEMVESAAR
jgi:hypothetical protein